jgi:thiol-disulfide isomerase/thioredoxin
MRPARLASPLLLALLFLLPSAPAPLVAQMIPPHATYQGFEPIGEYVLEIAGAPLPGVQMYRSDRAGSAVLMTGPGLTDALLLVPRDRAVQRFDRNKVVVGADGRAFLLSDVSLQRESAFQVEGSEVAFTLGGRPARLKEKPWLLGLHRGPELLQHDVAYAFRAKAYKPSAPLLKQLKTTAQPVRVRVFFGNWCPHCQEMVPRILRVEQDLGPSNVKFEFYGLPSPFGNEPEAKRMGITGVPTGVVYRGNQEIGRISGSDWTIPELAIKKVIDGTATKSGR